MVTQRVGYLSLGSNMGDPQKNLTRAVDELRQIDKIYIDALSQVYVTEPQGMREQAWFANQVVRIITESEPEVLLAELQRIETKLGRERDVRWGPRTLDMDILLLGDYESDAMTLQIPHPRMHERAFVLVPLAELDPDVRVHGRPVSDWLKSIQYSLHENKIWQAEV